jgi:GTP cyclohydrolase I
MDGAKMEAAIRSFLEGIGQRFEGDDLQATPARVARAWCEDLLSGYRRDPSAELTWTPVEPGGGPVLLRRVWFASTCVHHLLPFFGFAHVAYAPDRRLAGLSKIGRVIDAHARRLQTQERLTAAIADTMTAALEARGVVVLLEAEHTCMTVRGVRKEQGRMVTLSSAGIYRDDAVARGEILALLRDRQDGSVNPGKE